MPTANVDILTLPGEEWKEIDWIEGLDTRYFVSNLGRIRFYRRFRTRSFRPAVLVDSIHALTRNQAGYSIVVLMTNGLCKRYTVHRLVATAFIANPDGKPCINHIDAVRHNNVLLNLEWCTNLENQQHRWRLNPEGSEKTRGESHYHSKLTADIVRAIRATHSKGGLTLDQIGAPYGIKRDSVWQIVNRKSWKSVV